MQAVRQQMDPQRVVRVSGADTAAFSGAGWSWVSIAPVFMEETALTCNLWMLGIRALRFLGIKDLKRPGWMGHAVT